MISIQMEATCDTCNMPMIDKQNCHCQSCVDNMKKHVSDQRVKIELLEKEVERQKSQIILIEGGR